MLVEYLIHFDGSCPKNPGPKAGWGYTVHKNGLLFLEDSALCTGKPLYSNNVAEFDALYEALKAVNILLNSSDRIFVRGDSNLVVQTMNGRWQAKSGLYYDSYVRAFKELTEIRKKKVTVSIDWIPRERNKEADALSTANY